VELSVGQPLGKLSVGVQQLIEIARAVAEDATN
jgi:ABC-type sugar transport system ATPase subunit